MQELLLSDQQREIVERPIWGGQTLYVEGPAGAGKSTALWRRLIHLLSQPLRGESILVLVPDRAGRVTVEHGIQRAGLGPHGRPTISTYYGLARQMVRLFWPAIADRAGFADPSREPTFLTYESAQYLMHTLTQPLVEQGYFADLKVRRRRLTSQLLDNLNKAAINDFPYTEIAERLSRADPLPERATYYAQAQEAAERFRQACLERSAVDISLTIELFHRILLREPLFLAYFSRQFRHLIVDNVEETVPVAQDMLRLLLGTCDSATLAYDENAGYRILLGIDPEGARGLAAGCKSTVHLEGSYVANPDMARLSAVVARGLDQPEFTAGDDGPLSAIAEMEQVPYRSQMIRWTAGRIAQLVRDEWVRPADIAVICPYADGVLRFGLQEALAAEGVPFNLVRRWISFKDDPVARCLLTLAALAHPDWDMPPNPHDVAEGLHIAIAGLDLSRATLLAGDVYDAPAGVLLPPDRIDVRRRERIGFAPVEAYETLYAWLADYAAGEPAVIDRFLSRLFDEVLNTPAFWARAPLAGDEPALGAADPASPMWAASRSAARLIESAHKFRLSAGALGLDDPESPTVGEHYMEMVRQGIVAGRYVESAPLDDDAVLLVTPVYAYLLEDRRSDYQFWMDVGSHQWWRPPRQPLTNPMVLRRGWDTSQVWDEDKDTYLRNFLLARMVEGLTRRCRRQVFLCGSDVDSMGNSQDGPLFPALRPAFEEA